MRPTLSIVIATKGRPASLKQTLASIAACDPPPSETVVVDGDTERSAEEVARASPFSVRYMGAPPGCSTQRNIGMDACTSEIVLFLDDDAEIEPASIGILLDAYDDPTVVGATGRVVEPADRWIGHKHDPIRRLLLAGGPEGTFTSFGYPRYLIDQTSPRDVEFMQGCFMSARTSVARAVRFDEDLAGYSIVEDEDFSYRLSRTGRIRYLPEALVNHHKSGFNATDQRSFGRLAVSGRAYLFRKNFDQTFPAQMRFFLLIAMMIGQRLINFEWRGAIGVMEGAVSSYTRGQARARR